MSRTRVVRARGLSAPWHRLHPDNATITLCGCLREGMPIESEVDWRRERDESFACSRCDRLPWTP